MEGPTNVRSVASSGRERISRLFRRPGSPVVEVDDGRKGLVCHCRKVAYRSVREAIVTGDRTIADLQTSTGACTRCFGCRAELERMLKLHLGKRFRPQATVSLPAGVASMPVRPMYMPVLAGFQGASVDTRVVVFNWEGPEVPVTFRADLLRLDGVRVGAWEHVVDYGCSAVVDLSRQAIGELLPDGVGVAKVVLETESVGSLRPYFQFVTPTCISSTHEMKGFADPNAPRNDRKYHWVFPIGESTRLEEAYFFVTNTQMEPMPGELVWTGDNGETASTPTPTLRFDQSMCVPLHERLPLFTTGGAVRLAPATHAVAGFMMRHEPERQLWRVQHL